MKKINLYSNNDLDEILEALNSISKKYLNR